MDKENQIEVKIIRRAEQKTSDWSGGTTTELSIWPDGADYKERRFGWRISSARVDLDESDFTSLPGVHRSLIILEGSIHLIHEGIRERDMTPFAEADEFEGSWATKSKGRCVDFNLMTSAGYRGSISAVSPGSSVITLFVGADKDSWETFYCLAEDILLLLKNEKHEEEIHLMKGDFLQISKNSGTEREYNLVIKGNFDRVPMIRTEVFSVK